MTTAAQPRALGGKPLASPTTLVLSAALVFVVALIEIGVLDYTYARLGIGHRYFTALLLASLFGSVVNVPLTALPAAAESDVSSTAKPARQTIVAVNVGGA